MKHAKLKRFFVVTLPFIATGIMLQVNTILAQTVIKEGDEDKVKVLLAYNDVLEQGNILSYCLREIGWVLVRFLMMLTDETKALLDKAYKFLNFTEYGQIAKFMTSAKPILYSVFAIALFFYGYKKMINPEFGGEFFTNAIVAVMVVVALPSIMTMANDVVHNGRYFLEETRENDEGSSEAQTVVARNVIDILKADANGWGVTKTGKASIKKSQMRLSGSAKYIELIDSGEMVDGNADKNPYTIPEREVDEDVLDYSLQYISTSDTNYFSAREIVDGAIAKNFPPLTSRYYRYQIDWIPIFISLIAWIVVFFFSSYKVVRIIFELAMEKIIAPFFATGDLSNGKKARQILLGILNSYIVLVVIMLVQNLFMIVQNYLALPDEEGGLGLSAFQQAFFLIFIALAVVDGPNIIEQVLGIDAGLKSGFGLFAIARTVKSTVMAPINMASRMAYGYNTPGKGYGTKGHNSHSSETSTSTTKEEAESNLSDESTTNNTGQNQNDGNTNMQDTTKNESNSNLSQKEENLNNNLKADSSQVKNETGEQETQTDRESSLNSSVETNGSSINMGQSEIDPSERFGSEGLSDLFKADMTGSSGSSIFRESTPLRGRDGRDGLNGLNGRDGRNMPQTNNIDREYRNELGRDNLKQD